MSYWYIEALFKSKLCKKKFFWKYGNVVLKHFNFCHTVDHNNIEMGTVYLPIGSCQMFVEKIKFPIFGLLSS